MKFRIAALVALAFLFVAPAHSQTNFQFPTTPWQAYAPARIQCGSLLGANMNVTTDQAIPISVPSGLYMFDSILVTNPSVSLTTAAGGLYTAASKGGVAVVASGQAYSGLTTKAANTTGNALLLTIATAGNTTAFDGYLYSDRIQTLYLSLTTPQGAAATADFRVYCRPAF